MAENVTVNNGRTVVITDKNRNLGTVTIHGDGKIKVETLATVSIEKLVIV